MASNFRVSKRELKPDLAYQRAFGQRVKKLRESLGWTQIDLAVHSRVSEYQISVIENGHEGPNFQTLLAISLALGMYPSQLLDFKHPLTLNTEFPKQIRKSSGSTTLVKNLLSQDFFKQARTVGEVVSEIKKRNKTDLRSSEVSSVLLSLTSKKILKLTRKENKNLYVLRTK